MNQFAFSFTLDKQIPTPSLLCGEAVQYILSLALLCSLSLLLVLALASTNRLIDPKWNTELINTVLMRVCCSITGHLNHPAWDTRAIRFLSYAARLTRLLRRFSRSMQLSYTSSCAHFVNHSRCSRVFENFKSFVTFYPMLKIGAFYLTTNTYDCLFLHPKWAFMNVTNEVKVQPHWLGW